ncbi:HD-GYP domain-containing protein [Clostridium sp. FAM 1755]|uniref:HD domain-containing protein n=2 Tax=Clostridium TaxID=1485 RepID=A0A6M0T363_CLOBO|nr:MULTISPECIES: HD domain-containing phosphohydrolase [Clostridium]NFA61410.1 HD domain-containing protein [Clostridium botulinum]KOR24982.1 hydrolase [Clostridium sp. L74]MDS1002171.1 HD domain-containing protein [Clostridium sporogenes]NFI73297.1 HD domain-containing protein [Clostridium sporogenes]NFL73027.1 HD domain-containing protein [Clostridium sporogenes]
MYKLSNLSTNSLKISKDEKLDLEVFLHSKRVASYVKKIAEVMNLSSKQSNNLVLLALNHDIGKARIPSSILNKKGELSCSEFEIVKEHTQFGADILGEYGYCLEICNIVKFHHENFDGSGYYGLEGKSIPMAARILRIADVYEALTSDRCYRKAYTREAALEIMQKEKNIYDPKILELFIKSIYKNYLNLQLCI